MQLINMNIFQLYGKSLFSERFLLWDSIRDHLKDRHVKKLNSKTAFIPGGCNEYIQASDVSQNRPFKAFIQQKYDGNGNCPDGNLKPLSKELVTKWIDESWNSISRDIIRDSLKSCGLTTALDDTEDKKIHCLKYSEPCRADWDILQNYCDGQSDAERSVFTTDDFYALDRRRNVRKLR